MWVSRLRARSSRHRLAAHRLPQVQRRQQIAQAIPHLQSTHDLVDQALLQQKLRRLKSLG